MEDTWSMTNFYWWDVFQVSFSPDFLFVLVFLFPNTISLLNLHICNFISSFLNTLLLKAISNVNVLKSKSRIQTTQMELHGPTKLNFESSLEHLAWYSSKYGTLSQAKLLLMVRLYSQNTQGYIGDNSRDKVLALWVWGPKFGQSESTQKPVCQPPVSPALGKQSQALQFKTSWNWQAPSSRDPVSRKWWVIKEETWCQICASTPMHTHTHAHNHS